VHRYSGYPGIRVSVESIYLPPSLPALSVYLDIHTSWFCQMKWRQRSFPYSSFAVFRLFDVTSDEPFLYVALRYSLHKVLLSSVWFCIGLSMINRPFLSLPFTKKDQQVAASYNFPNLWNILKQPAVISLLSFHSEAHLLRSLARYWMINCNTKLITVTISQKHMRQVIGKLRGGQGGRSEITIDYLNLMMLSDVMFFLIHSNSVLPGITLEPIETQSR